MEEMTKFDFSEKILWKRSIGNIDDAVNIALQAKERYPEENIFEKLLGDLYFQSQKYEMAGAAYINFLKKIGDKIQYIKHFAHFLQRYSDVAEKDTVAKYCGKVEEILKGFSHELGQPITNIRYGI